VASLRFPAALQQPFLGEASLQPLATPAQRLVNGSRRGGKAPLQDLKRKADILAALVVALGGRKRSARFISSRT